MTVPSMFTVAPIGTRRRTRRESSCKPSSSDEIVAGIVAELGIASHMVVDVRENHSARGILLANKF